MWLDVLGYEGIYEVDEKGNVRTNKDKVTYTERHGMRKWKQRELKQKVSKDNSHRVSLWKDGKEKTWLVHRLVAYAFIPRVEGKDYINHIDGNRNNNSVENLEWCNHKENNNHAFDNGLTTCNKKIKLKNLITEEEFYFRSMSKASQFLGKNKGYISSILKKGVSFCDNYEIDVLN